MKKLVLIFLALITVETKATEPAFWFLMAAITTVPAIITCCMPKKYKRIPDYQGFKQFMIGYTSATIAWTLANYTLTSDNNFNDFQNQETSHGYPEQIAFLQQTIERLKACNCSCP